MKCSNDNKSQIDKKRVNLSAQDCNNWITDNPEKIVNLYLKSVLDQKKKATQQTLNQLVKKARSKNISVLTGAALDDLKELTQFNQNSFNDWKQESNLSDSKIHNFSKNIKAIEIESIEKFLKRGGFINKSKK